VHSIHTTSLASAYKGDFVICKRKLTLRGVEQHARRSHASVLVSSVCYASSGKKAPNPQPGGQARFPGISSVCFYGRMGSSQSSCYRSFSSLRSSTYIPSARKLKARKLKVESGERQLYTRQPPPPPTVASQRTVPNFYYVSFLSHVVDSLYCTA
jgi:hypothetical protein